MQQQNMTADFRILAIDQLRESPTNPRRSFDPAKLEELAQSIRAQGVLVPLIVRSVGANEFEVVAGARRYRAAQAAELFAVPVRIVELTDDEALTLQLVENAQREDVHPLEEAFAYRALLNMREPRYDVPAIALKVGKSVGHVYGRLRYVDLIEPAAQAFTENRLTAGHALLIARLPQSKQSQALEAAFRSHWGSTEKQAVPIRELAQWIRQNLMLRLDDAIFDREDETLVPQAGSCVHCPKRTGFNSALFDDFRNDDQCLDSACNQAKVSAWLKRQTEQNPSLVQISEYYGPHREEPIVPRSQYVEILPVSRNEEPRSPNAVVCESTAMGIVVEGNRIGKTIQICADPECHIHHAPEHPRHEERDEELESAAEERRQTLAANGTLLDSVLAKVPAVLGRPDYELIISAWFDSLDYEDFECLCERHPLSGEDTGDDPRDLYRQHITTLPDVEVSRFLVELALLPSGYSSQKLEEHDRLMLAARLYGRPRKRIAAKEKSKRKQGAKQHNLDTAKRKKKVVAGGAA